MCSAELIYQEMEDVSTQTEKFSAWTIFNSEYLL